MIKTNNARIENGKLYGIVMINSFTVALHSGTVPSITPRINLDGMPLDMAMGLLNDGLKVKARAAGLKKMEEEDLVNTFNNKDVLWSDLVVRENIKEVVAFEVMPREQQLAYIKALQNRVSSPAEDDNNE